MHTAASTWAPVIKPCPVPAARLICFPYAGGSAWMYRLWRDGFPTAVEIRGVQLPGRGPRLHEPRVESVRTAAAAVAVAIAPLADQPIALFGHSLGALIAFECARCLQAKGTAPIHLFVSAEDAPHFPDRNAPLHRLPDTEFLRELRALNGMPQAILDSPELLELLMPVVRSDFAALETYVFEPGPTLACPITVIGGTRDPRTSPEGLHQWSSLSSETCTLEMVEGDHFFVDAARARVVSLVSATLARSLEQTSDAY